MAGGNVPVVATGPLRVALIWFDPVGDRRRHIVIELFLSMDDKKPVLVAQGAFAWEWRGHEAEKNALEKQYGRALHAVEVVDSEPVVRRTPQTG